ncbi:alpha-L-iduronidase-like isoform X2 [Ptychodera flava]|uniref:alpha-L-iduronidase-like isoform X2 n=1 Tax=Ptychodera flava TaxID=63121 RepID=UPI00396A92B9
MMPTMHSTTTLLLFVICGYLFTHQGVECTSTYNITVQNNVVANLTHFWKSTGFCPPKPHQEDFKYFLSEDEVQNLAYIGSAPHDGIEQVRIHWLLDMVTLTMGNGTLSYNFSRLDQLIDLLWQNNLSPGFEIMGNPSNYFKNFDSDKYIRDWSEMVRVLAKRYIDQYGLGYVSQWNFETWNEPDNHDFDDVDFSLQGFLNYYDACSEGLKAASPQLKFGGPGGGCKDPPKSPICWALLEHCESGKNYFTGEIGVRLDYISIHHKGEGSSSYLLNTELETIQRMQLMHPKLAYLPFYNDEADPLVGWSKGEDWRADARYAAVVAKIIAQHQNLILSKPGNTIHYALLSNDNGFMNFNPHFFDERTLLARFQMNNTKPRSVQFIKKPVFSVMGLLALLGEEQLQAVVKVDGSAVSNTSNVGVIASQHTPTFNGTADSWQAAILIYNSDDTSHSFGQDTIMLNLPLFDRTKKRPNSELLYAVYLIDNQHGNPNALWEKMGKPVFPTKDQFREMRKQQEAVRIQDPKPFTASTTHMQIKLNMPGISLVHICEKPDVQPDQVTGVRLHNIINQDVLIIWDDGCVNSKCIKTYEVEFSSKSVQGPYQRVNDVDLIFTAYLYSPKNSTNSKYQSSIAGFYRVRAVDYWNAPGEYSIPVQLKV